MSFPEQIFDGRFSNGKVFDIGPLAQGGSYTARDRLAAGFAMTELALTDRLRLIGGARYERDHLDVNAISTLGSPVLTQKRWNDLLPSLSLNVKLNETQQLRLSASRTLARPEYRELSPIKAGKSSTVLTCRAMRTYPAQTSTTRTSGGNGYPKLTS